jgi:hypothetical protein
MEMDNVAGGEAGDGDDEADNAPGAKESVEQFREQDRLAAQAVHNSKKARGLRDLSMVFSDLVEIEGKTLRVCQVCE